ncbi:g2269 [Coccomyxa viridis]|uniref:G2269 protein n=1 Tax=Coccomyxa viridis TaxID=1274662 RepID=A0ABP1FJY7_9CHLO
MLALYPGGSLTARRAVLELELDMAMKKTDVSFRQYGKHRHMLRLIDSAKDLYMADELLQLGYACLKAPCAHHAAAKAAFRAAHAHAEGASMHGHTGSGNALPSPFMPLTGVLRWVMQL